MIAAFAKTLSAQNIKAFAALFADDNVTHQVSAAALKPAATVTAKQGTLGFFAARLEGMPDLLVVMEASLSLLPSRRVSPSRTINAAAYHARACRQTLSLFLQSNGDRASVELHRLRRRNLSFCQGAN